VEGNGCELLERISQDIFGETEGNQWKRVVIYGESARIRICPVLIQFKNVTTRSTQLSLITSVRYCITFGFHQQAYWTPTCIPQQ